MPTNRRQGQIARAIFEALADKPEGLPKTFVLTFVQERVPPSRAEQASPESEEGLWGRSRDFDWGD